MTDAQSAQNRPHRPRRGRFQTYLHSLKFELMILCFGLIALAIVLIMAANHFLLEDYYYNEKMDALEDTYEALNQAAIDGTLSSITFGTRLTQLGSRDNVNVLIMDQESQTVLAFTTDTDTMVRRMLDNIFGVTNELPEDFGEEEAEEWAADKSAPNYYIVKTLVDEESTKVQIVRDKSTNTDYMERWGMLADGSYYLMRTAVDSIRVNSQIANEFTLYIGLAVLVFGFFLSFFVARGVTRPIEQISELSQRMGQLDFSAKYVSSGHQRNEIETLGDNMNDLSAKLEETISELKNANARLQQDIERRDANEEMQREFISNVTHELKTPIALIQGYAEGLQDGMAEDPEDRDYYCGVITDEAQKMNRMVQQLLSLTHLEFGQNNDLNYTNFDIVALVRSYLETAGKLAQDEEIEVRVNADGPVMVWADQFYAEEVFQNYYTNAVHHCEARPSTQAASAFSAESGDGAQPGGMKKVIDIRFERKDNNVRIRVFNTGQPIPEESLPRIWEKFYKVDKARTREYGGSGVGLSIVKALMDLMHQAYGAVNYDNGVEFWFELEKG